MTGRQVEQARIALNGVGPHPIRALNAESTLTGNKLDHESIKNTASVAAKECEPFSDSIASEWYRRKMVEVHVRRVLGSLIGEEG
jgi:CO/xanthine dehydrogenase FAD-binding subunit